MKSFDDLVSRLTESLKRDPELRAEVSNELHGHLEESARAFLAAGATEDEARAQAARAIGDEREVASALWEGNKRRVGHRRIGRWFVGGTLVTAAGACAVSIAWGAIVSVAVAVASAAYLAAPGHPTVNVSTDLLRPLSDYVRQHRESALTGESRAVFDAWRGTPDERAEKSRVLAEAAGERDRPIYFANYAVQSLYAYESTLTYENGRPNPDRGKLERMVGVLERAKAAEPRNGFYALAQASLLLTASAADIDAPEDAVPGFPYTGRDGRRTWSRFWSYAVKDPTMLARGAALFQEASKAEYIDSHVADFSNRRFEAMGPGRQLADEYFKAIEKIGTYYPQLNDFHHAADVIEWESLELARAGKVADAVSLTDASRRVAKMLAGGSHGALIELLVGVGIYDLTLRQEAMVYRTAGNAKKFESARDRVEAEERRTAAQWSAAKAGQRAQAAIRYAGSLDAIWMSTLDPSKMDLAPGRRAEYAVADETAAAWWVIVLAAAGLWPVASVAWTRITHGQWPAVLFMGWRRLAGVVVGSVGIPLAAYAAYLALPSLSGREWSLTVGWDRLLVEYAAVGCGIIILLRILGERAVRARAREVGVTWAGEPPSRPRVALGCATLAGVITYLVLWRLRIGSSGRSTDWHGSWGVFVAAGVFAYAFTWWGGRARTVRSGWRRELPPWVAPALVLLVGAILAAILGANFGYATGKMIVRVVVATGGLAALGLVVVAIGKRLSAPRREPDRTFGYGVSMAPAALAAAVGLSLAAGWPARIAERHAVTAIEARGSRVATEIDRSYWANIRDDIAKHG